MLIKSSDDLVLQNAPLSIILQCDPMQNELILKHTSSFHLVVYSFITQTFFAGTNHQAGFSPESI